MFSNLKEVQRRINNAISLHNVITWRNQTYFINWRFEEGYPDTREDPGIPDTVYVESMIHLPDAVPMNMDKISAKGWQEIETLLAKIVYEKEGLLTPRSG